MNRMRSELKVIIVDKALEKRELRTEKESWDRVGASTSLSLSLSSHWSLLLLCLPVDRERREEAWRQGDKPV